MTVKYYRIKKRIDFENLFRKSKTIAGKLIFFRVKKNALSSFRFCVVVSSKVSKKAVVRNKIKRRIKEIVKTSYPGLRSGFDIAIIAQTEILNKKYSEIEAEVNNLFKSAKILK